MGQILFLPEAREDLRGIWRYLANAAGSIISAERVVDQIHAACRRYASQPELGERRPDLATDVRCFAVGSFVVYYEPLSDGIRVVQVIHGARDVAVLFRKRRLE